MSVPMIDNFKGEYRWLSNFHLVDVVYDGEVYPSTEHAYQAAKTLHDITREQIRLAPTPGVAKALGKACLLRPDWEEIKVEVMEDLLRQKFKNPLLKAKLLATVGHDLVEGNHWGDTFWGVCRDKGLNMLGKLLMQIRDETINRGIN